MRGNRVVGCAESVDHCRALAFTLAEIGSLSQLFICFLLILSASFNTLLYDAGWDSVNYMFQLVKWLPVRFGNRRQ